MAIGADMNIGRSLASPLRAPKSPAAPQSSPVSHGYRPFAVNDNRVADVANNQRAAGIGAGFGAMQEQDRQGISRGKGQQYTAQVAEAAANEAGRSAATSTEMAASLADNAAQRSYENTRANERLSSDGLLEGLRSSQATERLARQGGQQSLNEAWRRGQFGLDQQRLDYTPLLARLFDD